ncbi:hypothetical protein HDU98_005222 [Podochytrium sp. JEL0797]|nr:hypothetical protein HDU98_005222 [Podochytrium sp. JEL0797]
MIVLPPELLSHIFSYVEFGEFPTLSLVSRSWRTAAFSLRSITISASLLPSSSNLSAILSRFTVLESMHVEVSVGITPSQLLTFTGHRTLASLSTNSPDFASRVLLTCPHLSTLRISFMYNFIGGGGTDLTRVLWLGRFLKRVELENPEFVVGSVEMEEEGEEVQRHELEKLVISSLSNEALELFPLWMNVRRLDCLTEFSLDGD